VPFDSIPYQRQWMDQIMGYDHLDYFDFGDYDKQGLGLLY